MKYWKNLPLAAHCSAHGKAGSGRDKGVLPTPTAELL